ncbi:HPr(Ser) kinase/phosphatase [Mycoplasmopsis lipofaciens]|uniref:HPr(Ser) kinase/phosphatase n=1 Tax=Mycoplasmopsis lipofaciens TaxID=114884 RepID=UPI000489DC4B|nr:HPr(Ser) kinase/phosphatase [Mycoplasmopsis lipofaciens]
MKKQKAISVSHIIKKFEIDIVNKNKDVDYGFIYEPAIKRLGLELANKINNPRYSRNVICWGTSESEFFRSLGHQKTIETLDRILKLKPPLIILSKGVSDIQKEWIIEVANKYKIPVYLAPLSSSKITSTIGTYLSDFYSEETQVHACLVSIGGVGVLIIGKSGSGKSEATLELIQKGHIFISDDAVIIKRVGANFYGTSPMITKNLIEARGIGLIDVKFTYGIRSIADGCNIDLVVELINQETEEATNLDRLGIEYLKYEVLNGSIDKIQIPMKNGASAAALIEAAVSTYLARKDGVDILELMRQRGEKDE